MQILKKSVTVIDYENNRTYNRDTPQQFQQYVEELISHINGNSSVRHFKTRSVNTEVVRCALDILNYRKSDELVHSNFNNIANRLLLKEVQAQSTIAHLHTNLQKGSLVQALIYDETQEVFLFLLSKVEHSDFVDDSDYTFKTGFSKDKKSIWKSCLINLEQTDENVYYSKIHSNTQAKFWKDDFLEFDEMVSDETNTQKSFKAIEATLNKNIKNIAPRDHTIIRNQIIGYYKSNDHIDYDVMINSILENYVVADLPQEKLGLLKLKLLQLPENKNFDHQFSPVASVINARIKTTYDVNNGVQIKITDTIPDLFNTISSYTDPTDGYRYIRIKTNNETTYKKFLHN